MDEISSKTLEKASVTKAWKQTLVFPTEAIQTLSPHCIDLIRHLICNADQRLDLARIKAHPWFRGIEWRSLRTQPSPYIPSRGGAEFRDMLQKLQHLDPADAQYQSLVKQITANFDEFPDQGLGHNDNEEVEGGAAAASAGPGKGEGEYNKFIGYTYRRKPKSRLPPEVNRVLYVRNLPFKISSEEMYDIFGKYGAIRQIRLGKTCSLCVDHLSGFNVCGRYLVVLYYQASRVHKSMDVNAKQQELSQLKARYGVE
ncbi:hypothetical protein DYB25_002698 [Aphanomyces astaci]|uniref:RRM domain-containing protein n=2 Tax=Aphanomyces astaci TaxID=112090 RepID=A0A397BAI2_APHAT|nr:hypothetical protein DYB25_002698 [Aphanomyces astaci]